MRSKYQASKAATVSMSAGAIHRARRRKGVIPAWNSSGAALHNSTTKAATSSNISTGGTRLCMNAHSAVPRSMVLA